MSGTQQPRITVNEVAAAAGVSRSTVSLVLRGSSRIPAETRERVEQAMQRIGYTYNRAAANLRSRSSTAIGLMINDIANPFFAELTSAVGHAADAAGMMLYLVDSDEDLTRQARLLTSLHEHGVAGLIICPATGTKPSMLKPIVATGVPICVGVRPIDVAGTDFAGPDHQLAAELAMGHFVEQGHRSIAFLGGEAGNPARARRLDGYRAVLTRHNLVADLDLVFSGRPGHAAAHEGVEWFLGLRPRPTAILCYNDSIAIAALHALRERGVEPGRDVAIAGLDGTTGAELAYPSLTTVMLDPRRIGEEAIRLVLARINTRDRSPSRVVIEPRLIVRASSTTFEQIAPAVSVSQ